MSKISEEDLRDLKEALADLAMEKQKLKRDLLLAEEKSDNYYRWYADGQLKYEELRKQKEE